MAAARRGTRFGWFCLWLRQRTLVAKYAVLSLVPQRLHPKLAKGFVLSAAYYRSNAKGYRYMAFNPHSVDRIFQLIDFHRRKIGARPEVIGCT